MYAPTVEKHDETLRQVLEKLKYYRLSVRREKCKFRVNSVDYLGHTIVPGGIQPKGDLIRAVQDAPTPTNKDQIRSFLGLCEFMSKYIKNFATRVAPLRVLLKQGTPFEWTSEHEAVFLDLKAEIGTKPKLHAFTCSGDVPTILTTDASQYGLGAVLSQVVNGKENVIAFISRTLSEAEKNYSVIEKEMLAGYWASLRLRSFLWGRPYIFRTDHKPLVHILTTKGASTDRTSQRINKWSSRLLEYNFTATYVPGANNIAADCLSRLPIPANPAEYCDDMPEDESIAQIQDTTDGVITPAVLVEATNADPDLQLAKRYTTTKWPLRKSLSGAMLALHDVAEELSVHEGILYRGDRIVIPSALQEQLVRQAHKGHFGMSIVKRRIREHYWWPAMDRLVENTVRDCTYCSMSDKPHKCHTPPLTPIPLPDTVWQKLAMDIIGPFTSVRHKFAIVLVDFYSKWCEVKFTSEVTTKTVISFLETVFAREGLPECIVTDNGVQFVSHEMTEFLKCNGITHSRSTLYHPQTNGLVERMNRTVKEGIQIGKLQNKDPVTSTRERLVAYHSTPNGATGKAPFELMRGRRAKTKLLIVPPKNTVNSHETIKRKVDQYQAKYRKYFNKRLGIKMCDIRIGDQDRVKIPRHVLKGEVRYSEPVRVINVQGSWVTLENKKKWNLGRLVKVADKTAVRTGDGNGGPESDNVFHMDIDPEPSNRNATDVPVGNQPQAMPSLRRGNRCRGPPTRLRDYVVSQQ